VAFFSGGLLACAGLLLQVFFQNPLAGPDLLGINSGASLGVALAIMGSSVFPEFFEGPGLPLMAILGSLAVFFLLTFVVRKNGSSITLIIMGLLIASFTSSLISILVNLTPSLQVKNFMMWSMGSFQAVTLERLSSFGALAIFSMLLLLLLPKKLNQFMIGEHYAKSMGMNVGQFKWILILICSFIVAVVTIFCGPIGFIGIIAPHLARTFLKQSDLRFIMPATFLVGAILALFSESILIFTSEYSFATNSILGLIGAPIIALYFLKERRSL
jgi:iron complex transport system permease protein